MRTCIGAALTVLVAALAAAPAAAGPLGLSVGGYGGVNLAPPDDPETDTLVGAKVRLTPAGGFLAVEVSYTRVSRADAEDVWDEGDLGVVLHGDGFDLYGADLLLGNPGGPGPMHFFLVGGVNVKELSELDGDGELRMGAQAGAGLEFGAPMTGLSLELRGAVVWLDWTEPGDLEFASATAGLNYSF